MKKISLPLADHSRGQGIDPSAFERPAEYTQFQTWLGDTSGMEGCPVDCRYCFFQLDGQTPAAPTPRMAPGDLVDALGRQPTYHPAMPVNFGSQTDAFSTKRAIAYYTEVLQRYAAAPYPNPVVFITKRRIPDAFLDLVRECGKAVVFFQSYSGLAGTPLEPTVQKEDQEENFIRLRERGIPCVHYWRPFVPQNSDTSQLRDMLAFVSRHAQCSVVNGLRLNDGIRRNVADCWPELGSLQADFTKLGEVWPRGVRATLGSIAREEFPGHPLFFGNTPCALGYAIGQANPQGLHGGRMCAESQCPPTQRQRCEAAATVPGIAEVTRHAVAAGLDPALCSLEDWRLVVRSRLSLAQFTFLRTALRLPVTTREDISYDGGHNWAYVSDAEPVTEVPWS